MKKFSVIIPILLILLTGCADSAQPYNIHLNMPADAAHSINIVWQSDDASSKQSIFVAAANSPADGRKISVTGIKEDDFLVFACEIDNLEPDTEYIYRIGDFEASFKTAATEGGFSMLFLGDPQPDTSLEASIEEQYEQWGSALEAHAKNVDFVLLSGDLVNDSYEMPEWDLFFNAGKDVFSSVPFSSAMGNHDKSDYYKLLMNYPSYPNAPSGMEDEYYSFDYQNVHFSVINSNNIIDDKAYQWLEDDLSGSTADFKLVMMHHSLYSASNMMRDEERSANLRERFEDIFLQNDVDMVLVGHEHRYMRTKPLANEEINAEEGIVYLMGVSGAKSYDGGANEYSDCFIINEQVYTIFEVDGKQIAMKTYTNAGDEIDSFTLTAD